MRDFSTFERNEPWRSKLRSFQTKIPVDVLMLATSIGLKVWEVSRADDFSGMIKKDPNHGGFEGYSILVNSKHSFVRKRFTVAHEIAHFLLHRSLIGNGITDDALYRSGLSTLQEVQANKLAADILMPFDLLERELRLTGDVSELASRFEVSQQAMRIRLQLPT